MDAPTYAAPQARLSAATTFKKAPAGSEVDPLASSSSEAITDALYLPPLLSSLPQGYHDIDLPTKNPPLHTKVRLPHIDPESFSLHKALHYFHPKPGYGTLPYANAFNWNELELPEDEEREWYIVAFRSKRKEGSDGGPLYAADELAHDEAIAHGGLIMYWYGVPDPTTGLNLASCVWESRKQAVAAASGNHHSQAMKLAGPAYEVYTLERHVLRKKKGTTHVTVEAFTGGEVGR